MSNAPTVEKPPQKRPESRDENRPLVGQNEHGDEHAVPDDLEQPRTGVVVGMVVAFAVLLLLLLAVGIIPNYREVQETRRLAEERQKQKLVVSVMRPKASTGEKDVILPCNISANQSTALYTRTNGYLKKWNFDIGAHVDEGQVMAEIEAPEVDAQLAQSKAAVKQNEAAVVKAKADLDLARVTYARYVDAQKKSPGSVTQEDVDTKKSAFDNASAGVQQAEANLDAANQNVNQLTVTQGFQKIIAPFSGTVTARNYDVGALLSPTITDAGKEIFDLAQTDPLRVFVNVPQGYANNVKIGQKAFLAVRNFPRKFEGTVALTAGALDSTTRTLRVQIDFPNKEALLFAGEYGLVTLPVTPQVPVAIIPTSGLIFNAKGLQVAVVDSGNKIHFKQIKVGRDFGTEIEVTSGLGTDDLVITNPGERVVEGAEVQPPKEMPDDKAAPTSMPAK